MGMPQRAREWTRDEVLALPDDGNRYELIDGELLVSPSPSHVHQRAVGGLFARLRPFVGRHAIGEALFAPADLDLNSQQLSQPDLFVVSRLASDPPYSDWSETGVPLLAVEVLSPASARHDRITKRLRYQRSGIAEYWIVDLDARLIERWTPQDLRPEILNEMLAWHPEGASEPLVVSLPEFFHEVWGDRQGPPSVH